MKEIKAYVHRTRIGDVIAALKASSAWRASDGGDHNLTIYMVKGSLIPLNQAETHYSLDLAEEVVNEYKLELHCSDAYVDELVEVIGRVAKTGQAAAGWIYVVDVEQTIRVS